MTHDPFSWMGLALDAVALTVATGTGVVVWLRRKSARHWPSAFGKVEFASNFQDNSVWRTDVSYSYSVGADFYSGQFQLRARSEKKANEQVLRWNGQNIGVRYSPKNPEISVVRIDDQAGLHGEEYRGH